MKYYFAALQKYAVFQGRATRAQYWWFVLIFFLLLIFGLIVDEALGFPMDGPTQPVTGLLAIIHLLPTLAIQSRRLHDIGKSGWWQLLGIIPLAQIVLLVFYATASEDKDNQYGPLAGRVLQKAPATGAQLNVQTQTVEKLERLAALKASGALDDSEFQQMKADLLGKTK